MSNKRFAIAYLSALIAVILIHVVLLDTKVIVANFYYSMVADAALFVVFALVVPAVVTSRKNDSNKFVNTFLVMTSVQMLAAMAILAAYMYVGVPDFRTLSLQFVSIFVILLAIQSFFLIKLVNAPK